MNKKFLSAILFHKKEDFLLVNYVEFLLPSLCNDLMQ